MKFVFPAIWIIGFGVGTISMWLGVFDHGPSGAPPIETRLGFLALWILGSAFIFWKCSGLKRVRLQADKLYVSNYFREIGIQVSQIERVSEVRWINIHPVTIHLRQPSEFGDKITFMPTVRFFGWSSHPVVEELLHTARMSRIAARGK